MTLKNFIRRKSFELYEFLVISKCPCCGDIVRYSGTLCRKCLEKYEKEKECGCVFCGLPAVKCVCSTRDLKYTKQLASSMRSIIFYDEKNECLRRIIGALKRSPDRNAEKFFARELSMEILKLMTESGEMCNSWYITYPPRTVKAKNKYGFDQSQGLAKRVSEYTGLKFENVFVRIGSVKQKALDSENRSRNAKSSLFLSEKANVKGKRYIVVDDIITTGATVARCQWLLKKAGAEAAYPVSIAKTPRKGLGTDLPNKRRKPKDLPWFNN